MEVMSSISKSRMLGFESQLHSYIVCFFFNLDKLLFIYQKKTNIFLKSPNISNSESV